MPIYQGTGAGTSRTVAKVLRGTGANTYREIDHIYAGVSPTEYHEVFVRPALPTITSFAISPTNGTAGSLASTPNITASWTVGSYQALLYNYGAVMTAGQSGRQVGWSRTTTPRGYRDLYGSVSITPPADWFRGLYWDNQSRVYVVVASGATVASIAINGVTHAISGGRTQSQTPAIVSGQTYNIQATATDGRTAWPDTQAARGPRYPTISIAQTNADGSTLTHVVTAVPSGTQTIQTPTQDATFRFDATNIEGTRSARARFDYRTALSNLSIVITGYRPQAGTAANIQEQPVVRFSWTGDPSSAYVLAPTASPARIDNVQNGSEHTFLVPFGEAARDLVFQLLCSGVDTNNASIGLTANRTIHVPARSG